MTVSPGFTATEAIRAAFGGQPLPPETAPVEHVGRVVCAISDDAEIGALSGSTVTVTVADLAERYEIERRAEELE